MEETITESKSEVPRAKLAYYPSLDGLRAVAVFVVLLAHAETPLLRSGTVGVDVFFVLSGFLITSILVVDYDNSRFSFKNFYARRCLRLMPCLLLTCAFVFAARWFGSGDFNVIPVLSVLTYTVNWARVYSDIDFGGLGHCWSLAVEEQYYLIWPAVVLALQINLRNSLLKASILLFATLVLAIYRFSMVGSFSVERIYFGLDTHMDGLVLGSSFSYLAYWLRNNPSVKFNSSLISYVLAPLSVVSLFMLLTNLAWWNPNMGRYGYFLAAVSSTVLVADLTISPRSILKPILELPWLVYVGKISYGLYLLHLPIFNIVERVSPVDSVVLCVFAKFGLSILAASISYGLIEAPILQFKKYFS